MRLDVTDKEEVSQAISSNKPDESTFYTPGEKGCTDYPTLENSATA